MPKKLGQVAQLVKDIQDKHDGLLADLRKYSSAQSTHESMVNEGEAELTRELRKLRAPDAKDDMVYDYVRFATAKKMIGELENQRKQFLLADTECMRSKNGLKANIDAANDALDDINEIIADKRRKWITSGSLPQLVDLAGELKAWYDTELRDVKRLKFTQNKWPYMQPGFMKKMTVAALVGQDHRNLTPSDCVDYLEVRKRTEPKRKNAIKSIHDKMVTLAKANHDT